MTAGLKKFLKVIIPIIIVPVVVIGGMAVFGEKKYAYVASVVAILSCVPFFMLFEKREQSTKRIVILTVMITLAVVGRWAFAMIPHFKPLTAMVVITGMCLGAENGFLCGAMSAMISNIILGQGAWTPFQMMAWGLIGFFAAVFSKQLIANKIALIAFAVISGVFYSLVLDVWTVLWLDGGFNLKRFYASVITALPVTAVYAVSNVIFLLLLAEPFRKKLQRVTNKYGLLNKN